MTYSAPILVQARFSNRNTGEIIEQIVFLGDFPVMTDKGTFIVNGTERVVVSQLVRSPGVIFQPGERFRLRNLSKHQLVTGTIHPYRGEWIEFDVEHKPGRNPTAGARVARKRRMSLFTLLRALGYDEERAPGFLDRFVGYFDFLADQWENDKHQHTPGEPCWRLQAGRFRRAPISGAPATTRMPSSRIGAMTFPSGPLQSSRSWPELDRMRAFGPAAQHSHIRSRRSAAGLRPDPDQPVPLP